jgi:hypothetical protein
MAKDILGNEMKIGDRLLFNNAVYLIKDIQENRIMGGKIATGRNITGIKVPDVISLEIDLPFNCEQPFNGFIVKTPPEMMTEKKPN